MTETGSTTEQMSPASGRRVRRRRIAGYSLLALLLPAVVLTWLVNDTERVRRAIESAVSAMGDRPFTIEGEFDYDLGRVVTIRAGKIHWRNSAPDTSPHMLEIEQFTGSFDLLSLFDRPVVVTAAQATNARLLFEWDEREAFNWRLAGVDGAKPAGPPDPLPLVIEEASVRNVSVRFRHPSLAEELEIVVNEARHQRDAADRLVVSAIAAFGGRELEIDGRIGPFPELAVGGAVDFDVKVSEPFAQLVAAGKFDWLARLREPELVAELTAPGAADLAHLLKLPLETTGSVRLAANLSTEGDGVVAAASGSFGAFEVDARFRTDNMKTLRGLELEARSAGPSLRGLGPIAGLSDLPDAPYEFDVHARRTEEGVELRRLRLDTTGLNIEGSGVFRAVPELRDMDLEFTAAGSDFAVVAPLFDLDARGRVPFELSGVVAGKGRGESDEIDIRLQLGGATARMTGSVADTVDFAGSRLRFSVDAPDANQLAQIAGIAAPVGAPLKVRGSTAVTAERINFEDLKASVADTELTGTAWLERKSRQPGFNFDGEAKGPDLAYILKPLLPAPARTALPRLPFAASARLRLAAGSLDIRAASASIGRSVLGFEGQLALSRQDKNLAGALSVRGDSLAELLNGLDVENIPDRAFSLKSRLRMSPDGIRFDELGITGEHVSVGGKLGFTGKGFSRIEFDLSGSGANLAQLVPDSEAYRPAAVPFTVAASGTTDLASIAVDRFEAQLGDARLELSGEMQLQPTLAAKGVRLTGSGPRLSDLGATGPLMFTDRPFEVSASMGGGARELLIDDLQLVSVENNLSGRFRYVHEKVPLIEITLQSSNLNLDEIRVFEPPEDEPAAAEASPDSLFSDDPLPFDLLDNYDGELRLEIDDLVAQERRFRNLAIEASLKDGVLDVRRAQADAARGELNVHGTVTPTPAGRSVTAEVTASRAMIEVQGMTPEELDRLPRNAIAAKLSATGDTPRELAASLDGFIWIVGGEGRIPRSKLVPIVGDFLTGLLGAINPFAEKKEYSSISCHALYFEITDGKVETSPASVLRTDQVIVFAVGKVDLASERIDVTFETTPRKGIGLSVSSITNPFTKLAGTLSSPQMSLDPKGTMLEGGVAVATGGWSILAKSLWKRLSESRQVCEGLGEEAVKIRTKRDPHNVPDWDTLIAGTRDQSSAQPETPRREKEKDEPYSMREGD